MINYPNKKKPYQSSRISHSNRGMSFESMINDANEYYVTHDIAVIHKKPIPIQIVKVDYPSRTAATIKEAYYKIPSTTDYNGIYKGRYIDFEAKETVNKTSFPLSNIHPHQMDHLHAIATHGGIGFILVYFKVLDEIYLLEESYLDYYRNRAVNGRKSIHIDEFREHGILVTESLAPRINYLEAVNIVIQKQNTTK